MVATAETSSTHPPNPFDREFWPNSASTAAAPSVASSAQPLSTRSPSSRSRPRWTGPAASPPTSPTAVCAAASRPSSPSGATPADRAAEADRLKMMHREVRGRGTGDFADVRYSALDPRLWNWIAVSGMFLVLNSFTPCTGIELNDAERELAYAQLLDAFGALELPGKNAKLPATYAEAEDYYESMVRDELQANTFLQRVTDRPHPATIADDGAAPAAAPAPDAAVAGTATGRRTCRQGLLLRHPAPRNPGDDRLQMGGAP